MSDDLPSTIEAYLDGRLALEEAARALVARAATSEADLWSFRVVPRADEGANAVEQRTQAQLDALFERFLALLAAQAGAAGPPSGEGAPAG